VFFWWPNNGTPFAAQTPQERGKNGGEKPIQMQRRFFIEKSRDQNTPYTAGEMFWEHREYEGSQPGRNEGGVGIGPERDDTRTLPDEAS